MIRIALPLALLAIIFTVSSIPTCHAEPAPAAQNADMPTEQINAAMLAWFDKAMDRVDSWKPAAEAVADRVIAGGRIYCAGNGGFCDEMFFRVGGAPYLQIWGDDVKMTAADVVYHAQFVPNEPVDNHVRMTTLAAGGRYRNNVCVEFASRRWPQISRVLDVAGNDVGKRFNFIDTDAPVGDSIQDTAVSQVAAMATAWAFEGEVLAAATRKGKMLATYASGFEKNPGQTDESVAGMTVNPNYTVDAIPAGKLGHEYLKACRDHLASISTADAAQMRKGAAQLVTCMKNNGMVWAVGNAHAFERGMQTPRDLPIKNFGREFDWDRYASKMPRGDALVWLGYVKYPQHQVQTAVKCGCPVVVMSLESVPEQDGVTQIHLPIDELDACVSIPNYPIKMLPISGVVHSVLWYDLMAETERLSRK